ncbi:type II toxin-antitoxin system death-on-curing family toxin [Schinkia azotoformans]|uniref:type II toxin-antitoxin system death-on-curing family toxin n=1 Tax=Schinkia azotoformans TaxID=1454 RepID=UPI002DBFF6E7|nr:type II toxin-antitoxin system death-on-curing family toxin [Schinkia azotoformans]MEC1716264.1 type II toxin-antitoxin system death-on-curing family toxin [Schinkia azotoformans]MEC1741641.1 type II toxin-antitoxin system death-on-curing family toxin [Schinkia azotoformans]MEC1745663.1 type II toxin-antitoxin system death-on-curing family toxin [Schinkia azotoformans]MEC1758967.1 type II toxin-antitoxin system death-on-curing family toxin [Schinkia azotoformans]MEC1766861.1 type II toxin-a
MNEIIYLTINQVITINTIQIRLYSPDEQLGVKGPNLLDSAVNRPKQSAFGKDAYPTIYEKAAALFESLAKNHAFHNANKRTALASLIVFLKINHFLWTMSIEEEQDFTVDVVNHKYTFKEIVSIIECHTERL